MDQWNYTIINGMDEWMDGMLEVVLWNKLMDRQTEWLNEWMAG